MILFSPVLPTPPRTLVLVTFSGFDYRLRRLRFTLPTFLRCTFWLRVLLLHVYTLVCGCRTVALRGLITTDLRTFTFRYRLDHGYVTLDSFTLLLPRCRFTFWMLGYAPRRTSRRYTHTVYHHCCHVSTPTWILYAPHTHVPIRSPLRRWSPPFTRHTRSRVDYPPHADYTTPTPTCIYYTPRLLHYTLRCYHAYTTLQLPYDVDLLVLPFTRIHDLLPFSLFCV